MSMEAYDTLGGTSGENYIRSDFNIMTFNLRQAGADAGLHKWDNRKDLAVEVIKRYRPAILGTQEALCYQIDFLLENLNPHYAWFGECRRGTGKDEHVAIFYDTRRLALEENGDFWLSETPDVPGSTSWDSSLPRVTTWGKFRRKNRAAGRSLSPTDKRIATDDEFYFFNTHLDHLGAAARLNSAALILRKMDEIVGQMQNDDKLLDENENPLVPDANKPPPLLTFLVGDFNSCRKDPPWSLLTGRKEHRGRLGSLVDMWLMADKRVNQVAKTRHDYLGSHTVDPRGSEHIDFMMYRPSAPGRKDQVKVSNVTVVTDGNEDGVYPSDHFPVVATVTF